MAFFQIKQGVLHEHDEDTDPFDCIWKLIF